MHTLADNIIRNIEPINNQPYYECVQYYDKIWLDGLLTENSMNSQSSQITKLILLSLYGKVTSKLFDYIKRLDHTIFFKVDITHISISRNVNNDTSGYIAIVNLYFEKEEHIDNFNSAILINKLES